MNEERFMEIQQIAHDALAQIMLLGCTIKDDELITYLSMIAANTICATMDTRETAIRIEGLNVVCDAAKSLLTEGVDMRMTIDDNGKPVLHQEH